MDLRPLALFYALGCVTEVDLLDVDGDSYIGETEDCDASDPEVHVGAEERCNGYDDNCDGMTDEICDGDQDGAPAPPEGEDCDDDDDAVHPGATEIARNGKDDDCDGVGTSWSSEVDLESDSWDADVLVLFDTREQGGKLGASFAILDNLEAEDDDSSDAQRGAELVMGMPEAGATGELCLILSGALEDKNADATSLLNCLEAIDGEAPTDSGDAEGSVTQGWGVSSGRYFGEGVDLLVSGVGASAEEGGAWVISNLSSSFTSRSTHALDPLGAMEGGRLVKDAVSFVGDLGGDGHDEIIIGVSGSAGEDGYPVGLFYAGTADASTRAPRSILLSEDPGDARALAGPGDLDGDGLADLLVGLPSAGKGGLVLLLRGYASLDDVAGDEEKILLDEADLRIEGESGWSLGQSVATGEDLDGDGADDLIIGAPQALNLWGEVGGAAVVFAQVNGLAILAPSDGYIWYNSDRRVYAGSSVALPGDTDADGQVDALVGSTPTTEGASSGEGTVAWLLRNPTGGGDTTRGALVGSDEIVAFSGELESAWRVAGAADMDLPDQDHPRTNGVEFLVATPDRVFLFWGKGM